MLILESDRKDQRLGLLDLQFAQRLAEHASVAIENARLTEELSRSLAGKSEFLGFAAHELKNPLTSIKGYAATLLNPTMFGMMNDNQKLDMLNVIRNNADRMQIIINDLRDAAAAEAKKLEVRPEPIDFRNVVIETLRPFQKQLEDKAQELINRVPENLSLVMGDQNRLIQVLTNLISNAHKYSPPESTITIGAEVVQNVNELLAEKYPLRRSKTRYNTPYLYAYVSDTGIGMSEEELGKLFREQYFRSKREEAQEQPGTGLGMMITSSIIQLHHGEIWATSEIDVGTTFHFIIPLAPQTEKTSQPEPASD
jgi:signal transduction histidine kinase